MWRDALEANAAAIVRAADQDIPKISGLVRKRACISILTELESVLTALEPQYPGWASKSKGVMMAARATRSGKPRDTLNRERVLRAAIELADEHGIDALTMRELAKKLGFEGGSLYYHVASKGDLLDGMTDLVAAEIEVPSDSPDWKEAMRRRAISARDVFSRHPWASAIMDSREHSGPAQLAYADRVLGILLAAGFTPRAAANAFLILDTYIYGFQRQQSSLSLPEGVETFDVAEELLAELTPDAYPSLLRIAADFAVNPHDEEEVFDFGLALILDGLERTLVSD